MSRIVSILIIAGLLFNLISEAQVIVPKDAKEFFSKGNYLAAIEIYLKLLEAKPDDSAKWTDYNHKLGLCYLNTNVDKKKAIPYLERVVAQPDFDKEVLQDLALAYHYAYRFDDAIIKYNEYIKVTGAKGKKIEKVNRNIETCYSAKEMMQFPIDANFENLGPQINSPYPDYYPFISGNETFIVYTSRRGEKLEFDGYSSSDIFFSKKNYGVFDISVNAGSSVNSDYDEMSVGLYHDGKTMFVYMDKVTIYGDIYTSERGENSFQKPVRLDKEINSDMLEVAAAISSDETTLLFSSDRPGGYGGLDIWMVRKLPNGQWAKPQNPGPSINTRYNEDFPSLAPDDVTFYFASEGHANMGGYDIFRSIWNPESNTWSPARNLRYPINTPDNNTTISFCSEATHAYIAAVRPEGFGDMDIYKVTLNDSLPHITVLRVQLPTGDSLIPFVVDTVIMVYEVKNDELFGVYRANQNNGIFTIALEPGQYKFVIEATNYDPYQEWIKLHESELFPPEMTKIIKLKKRTTDEKNR